MKKIYSILLCIGLVAGFVACEKDKEFALTKLMVQNETITPSYGSATIDCSFKADATISEAFVQYSLSSSFAKYDVAKMTEEKGKYAVQLTGLQDNTTYYIRYAVSNKYSSVVSEEVIEFHTLQCTVPTVVLDSIADVWDNRAKAYLHLAFDGGASVTDMGMCWGTQANPTIEDIHKSTKDTVTVLDMTDLQENTKYYVRAYAVNKVGVSYSEEKTFTTTKDVVSPTVTTATVTQITETTAVAGGNVTSDGGAEITERGVVYATTQNPTTADNKVSNGSGMGTFTCNLTDLQPSTTYYIRAYAINEKGTAYGEEMSFTTEEQVSISDPTGTENGYGYVDLGLSVKWASYNIGATKPEEYGDYFAWGEVEPKEMYDWSTYKWCNGSSNTLTKYNTSSSYGTVDNKTTLELSDDAARVNWGGAWRMPTDAEWTELSEQCTWKRTTQNGVNGYKVTSKSNGNSIFLPVAGYRLGSSLDDAGSYGGYWSSSLYTGNPSSAWSVGFDINYVSRYRSNRYGGQSVRPVLGEYVLEAVSPTVTTTTVTQITETTAVAGGNVTSDGNASVTERGVVYSTNPNPVITNLNNTIRPCGSGTGMFTYTMTDLQPNTTYYVRAYAKNDVGTAYGEEVSFTTKEQSSTPNNGTENGYAYVDLGLSVKWATMNVGASSPEEYGDYFAWGETTTKDTYNWSTYKWCNGSSSTLTKYCNNSSYGNNGFTDNKTQLELSDDAARANWGGAWRMPTDAEWTELHEQCTWTWTTQNGVYGRKVTSKTNGNSIFLPAAGYRGSSLNNAGSGGDYWSSLLYSSRPYDACLLYFSSGNVHWGPSGRYYGRPVRPVCQ